MKGSTHISVTPYVDVVFRHRRFAAGVFIVGLAVTIGLVKMLPNVYRSTAVIIVEPAQVSADYLRFDAGKGGENLSVAAQLQALAYRVFNEQRLADLITKFHLYGYKAGDQMEPRIALMQSNITLIVPESTITYRTGGNESGAPNVLKVSFEYYNADVTRRVTQELADSYIDEGYRERIQRADNAARFLRKQVTEARGRLDAEDGQIKQLESRYAGSLPQELDSNLGELERLQDRLATVNQQLASERLSFERMMPAAPGQSAASSPAQEMIALKLKLNRLRSEYSDDYPDVIQIKQQIADLKQQFKMEPASGGTANAAHSAEVDPAAAALQHEIPQLVTQIDALKTRIAATPLHEDELAAHRRDYDALATEYHGLLNKELAAELNANLQKHHQDEHLRLLEAATMPRRPERPNRKALAILGTFFSATIALALPFILYFTDTSLKDAEEAEEVLSTPVVATIPLVESASETRMAILRVAAASSAGVVIVWAFLWAYVHHFF